MACYQVWQRPCKELFIWLSCFGVGMYLELQGLEFKTFFIRCFPSPAVTKMLLLPASGDNRKNHLFFSPVAWSILFNIDQQGDYLLWFYWWAWNLFIFEDLTCNPWLRHNSWWKCRKKRKHKAFVLLWKAHLNICIICYYNKWFSFVNVYVTYICMHQCCYSLHYKVAFLGLQHSLRSGFELKTNKW